MSELPAPSTAARVFGPDRDLVQDLARRRERLDEDGLLVGDLARNFPQVRLRKRQRFGVRAGCFTIPSTVAWGNAGRGPGGTMATAAGKVDLADDPLAKPREPESLDAPDELVAGNAGEAVVTAAQLEVRVADAGGDHPHEGETGTGRRSANVAHGRRPDVNTRAFTRRCYLSAGTAV